MPSLPQRPPASRVVSAPRLAQRAQELLNQTLFQHALVRQQKQADRFEEPFGLVLISIGHWRHAQLRWPQVIDALQATARATDIIGWFEEGVVLGVIRSWVDMDHLETATSLQATVEAGVGPSDAARR